MTTVIMSQTRHRKRAEASLLERVRSFMLAEFSVSRCFNIEDIGNFANWHSARLSSNSRTNKHNRCYQTRSAIWASFPSCEIVSQRMEWKIEIFVLCRTYIWYYFVCCPVSTMFSNKNIHRVRFNKNRFSCFFEKSSCMYARMFLHRFSHKER